MPWAGGPTGSPSLSTAEPVHGQRDVVVVERPENHHQVTLISAHLERGDSQPGQRDEALGCPPVERLVGTTIVVTGGAQGLGLEIARAATAEGAFAILIDIDADALASARAELGPGCCTTFVCDIRDAAAVATTLCAVKELRPSGVRALVNNAGVFTNDAIEATRPDRGALAFEVNVHGTMNVTNTALELDLLDPASGQILFINSSAGDPLAAGTSAGERTYAATKGALTTFAKAITGACRDKAIRVTTVYPGGMDTNLYENAGMAPEASHGQPWMMPPQRVAAAVAFVLSVPADTSVSRLTIGPNLPRP
jgi:NADP-dependent 3-hydroxy acid dehydrogenase YdfG